MFSELAEKMDVDRVFETYKESVFQTPQLDVVFENYLSLVNQLKTELHSLQDEVAHHKKVHGDITNSLDEFFTIQRLSSIITQSLEYEQIVANLNDIAQKVIPNHQREVFLRDDESLIAVGKKPHPDFQRLIENMKEEGILDWLWEQGQPIVVPLSDFMLADQLDLQPGNLVIAPMILNQKGTGVYLLLTAKEQARFNFRDLELLNILTQQAAIAIQYTRLYKKLEHTHEALKNSQSRLMQTIKLATVGELAGGIAHEINNPLQIILGNVQMAMLGNKTEESLKVVESQAMRIANIIRGLLSMAKENVISTREYLEINTLIINTLNLIRGQIEKRGIEIKLDLPDKLPVIVGSPIYFQQILLNFILHAKKQIGRDGILTIGSSTLNEDWVVVDITDSGPPMPEEYVDKILDPFRDIENSTEMNLGLTVSVQMLREIGGEIKIEPGKESGNHIRMLIPRVNEKEESHEKEADSTG